MRCITGGDGILLKQFWQFLIFTSDELSKNQELPKKVYF